VKAKGRKRWPSASPKTQKHTLQPEDIENVET
jgi:hypothetical protein